MPVTPAFKCYTISPDISIFLHLFMKARDAHVVLLEIMVRTWFGGFAALYLYCMHAFVPF